MNRRKAKLIRIGIMARCRPYKKIVDSLGEFTIIDYESLREYQRTYYRYAGHPLVEEAYNRTPEWIKTWTS